MDRDEYLGMLKRGSYYDQQHAEEIERAERLTAQLAEKAEVLLVEFAAIAMGERPNATNTQLRAIIGALNTLGLTVEWPGSSDEEDA